MRVYVVTGAELGWDCVMAVFDNQESAEDYCRSLDDKWDEDGWQYVLHEQTLQS